MTLFRTIHYAFILFFCIVSDARAGKCSGYLKLLDETSMFLNQNNPQLGNLLIQDGGLCGPTCALNVVQLLRSASGRTAQTSDFQIAEARDLVHYLTNLSKKDARRDTDPMSMVLGIQNLLIKNDLQAEVHLVTDGLRNRLQESQLQTSRYDLWILTIRDRIDGQGPLNHWVVGVFDREKNAIKVVDPNRPDRSFYVHISTGHSNVGFPYLKIKGDENAPLYLQAENIISESIGIAIK